MAIIDNKDNYIRCDKCGNPRFVEHKAFTLREMELRGSKKIVKEKDSVNIACIGCGNIINKLIKHQIIE